jgi:anionic cell wall polymer biosynthesis LytR-Cps2A-Psr (LCP) family protein
MLINFSGFKKLIDLIGGVDIEVKQEFTDDRYPIEGKENDFCQGDINFSCRYEIVYFAQGWQHMDGEKALKYARSRYSESNEGNDFARSKRQQQLIIAVKEKLMATKFWFKPDLVKDLSGTYQQIVTTDMNWSEQISIGKILLDMQNNKIRHLSLDTGDDKNKTQGLLVNPPVWQYNGAWVLVPRAGDFSEIKKHITCYIDDPNCQLKP